MQALLQNRQHATWTEVRISRSFSWSPSRRHHFKWEPYGSQRALPLSSDSECRREMQRLILVMLGQKSLEHLNLLAERKLSQKIHIAAQL